MKIFRLKLYIIFLVVFCLTFGLFFGGYLLLSNNYINIQAGNNFKYMTDAVAVDFSLHTEREYNKFSEFIDELETENDSIQDIFTKINTHRDNLKIAGIEDYNLGYVTDDQTYHLYNSLGIIEQHSLKKDYAYDYNYYNDKVSIYKLSNLLQNNNDQTIYMFFKSDNILLYFNADKFISGVLNDVEGMPEATYLILQKDGNILIQENSNNTNIKFYLEYLSENNQQYKYDEVADNLHNFTSGFGIFNISSTKAYFIYSPVLQSVLSEPLFIGYKMDFNTAIQTVNYIRIILGVIFGTLFLIFNLTFIISGITYSRKEADVSLSRINQYYLKPFSVSVNRRGKIVSSNKSFKVNIDDATKYKYATDFELEDGEDDILEKIKKQTSFTAVMQSITKEKVYIHFIPIKNGFNYCLLGENITEAVNESLRNQRIALYNAVTGLPNKILLEKALDEIVQNRDIYKANYSLIAIDVIDFQKINRIFGFAAADKMLREMAKVLEDCCSDFEHVLYNIRTSLFMVLLKNVISYNDVIAWSKKCLAIFLEPINIKDDYLTLIDIKMGIFNIEPNKINQCDSFKIYECATTALDRAKNSRLTKCAIYNAEFGRMMTRDQIMEEDLRAAVENKEFVMFYQAQYNTKHERIAGFEALVRWDNPKYKLESVEHFISLAEKNGMIIEIGKIIIEETFKFVKKVEDQGVHVSMNVSPVQLLQSGFVNDLISLYDQYKLRPGSVAIEITETFLMENSDSIISKLKLLREKGFAIHLDDFGIGYSSMLYLKDLPVTAIKIDKEFVKHVLTDKFSRIIVSKVVQIALNLNLDIICEGVESDKQSQLLSKMGCNIIQGYLVSKPISESEAIKLLEKYAHGDTKLYTEKTKKVKSGAKKKEEDSEIKTDEDLRNIDHEIEENPEMNDIINLPDEDDDSDKN